MMDLKLKFGFPSWKKRSTNYFRRHSKRSLLSGGLIFVPAVVFTIFAFLQIFVPVNGYMSSGFPWDTSINDMISSTLLNMVFFAPAMIMFVGAYLQVETHSLGAKISIALALAFLAGAALNLTNVYLLLFCMSFCTLGAIVGFEDTKNQQLKKDSPVVTENVAKFGLRLSGAICVATLFGLISYVALRGAQFLSWNFISGGTLNYTTIGARVAGLEPGSIGGIRDFILGGLIVVGACELIAIPLGLGAAIFLAEYAPDNRFVSGLRFFIETLAGAPSVIIGLFGFTFFVQMAGMRYSLPAAALSLAFMILPWNIRVAEESMRAVPKAYREASYALGAKKVANNKKNGVASS